MPMDAELKTKWVSALRSGEYKQGRGKLRSEDDCYCSLGVCCDVSGEGEWVRKPDSEGNGYWAYCYRDEAPAAIPPKQLNKKWGLNDIAILGRLLHMNDMEKKTFPEIADYIEANI